MARVMRSSHVPLHHLRTNPPLHRHPTFDHILVVRYNQVTNYVNVHNMTEGIIAQHPPAGEYECIQCWECLPEFHLVLPLSESWG